MKKGFKASISMLIAAVMVITLIGAAAVAQTNPESSASDAYLTFGKRREDTAELMKYDFKKHTESSTRIRPSESRTARALEKFQGLDSFYAGLDVLASKALAAATGLSNNRVSAFVALKDGNASMRMNAEGEDMMFIIEGSTMTIYDVNKKTGIKMKASPDELELDLDSAFSEYLGEAESYKNSKEAVYGFNLKINGKNYRYEYWSGKKEGYLFDTRGELCLVVNSEAKAVVHAYTSRVPANAFGHPKGFEVITI
ncbi:MAG: hypothetical protein FWG90_04560 [Oscillospiraceae bacterium]|nr:hypothetical protein [Oscillospiraceae bacterium]